MIWTLTALYAVCGLAAMFLAPRVPYADAWRFLAHFLSAPFPSAIFAPDNGHHEVLPNIVRVIELRFFGAGQWLQILTGIALALGTMSVVWRTIRTMQDSGARRAALMAATLGIFWLGNVRTLAHANESVHAYFVTLFLMLGLRMLTRNGTARPRFNDALVAAVCGVAAAFSFGSGVACFAAFMAVLMMRRAGWREWCVISTGLLLTLLLLRWNGASGPLVHPAPGLQVEGLVRWLAGPYLYASWPALDPAVAGQIPLRSIRDPMQALASAYQAAYGPVMLARWPHVVLGVGGLVLLAVQSVRAWRSPGAPALLGIGIACFALAVGMMIVFVRSDYFQMHPEQLLAARYLVWSSLFWMGLAIAGIAQARNPRLAAAVAVLVALLLLPSQAWMGGLGARMVHVAERDAVAGATAVVEPSLMLGETDLADLSAALPLLRSAHAAMFAWPEAQWIGHTPPPGQVASVAAAGLQVVGVNNRIGPAGRRVTFMLDDAPASRLMMIDEDGVVRGLALRDGESTRWLGWMQGNSTNRAPPHVALLRIR